MKKPSGTSMMAPPIDSCVLEDGAVVGFDGMTNDARWLLLEGVVKPKHGDRSNASGRTWDRSLMVR